MFIIQNPKTIICWFTYPKKECSHPYDFQEEWSTMSTNYKSHNNLIHELYGIAIKFGYREIYNYIDDYWNEHDKELLEWNTTMTQIHTVSIDYQQNDETNRGILTIRFNPTTLSTNQPYSTLRTSQSPYQSKTITPLWHTKSWVVMCLISSIIISDHHPSILYTIHSIH